jgi:hypothetical protein
MTETNYKLDDVKVPSLGELGTRYTHYMELREIFSDGVEILKNAIAVHASEADEKRVQSLQHAAEEVDNRLEVLAGYEVRMSRWGSIADEIDNIPAVPKPLSLTEGSNVKSEKQVKPSNPHTNRNCTNRAEPPSEPTSV